MIQYIPKLNYNIRLFFHEVQNSVLEIAYHLHHIKWFLHVVMW